MIKKWLVKKINKQHFLIFGNKFFLCQIGERGIDKAEKKIEGDKKTPIGNWYLKTIYYRSDRILRPKLKKKNILKIRKITKNCAWCDDITRNEYNKYIKISNFQLQNIKYENLWRTDQAYDIIIETSHNFKPTIKNKGSAIFVHCSFENKRNTSGCVALNKKDIVFLLKNIKYKTYIKIQNLY